MKVYIKDKWGDIPGNSSAYISDYVKGPAIRVISAEMYSAEIAGEDPVLLADGWFNACRERLKEGGSPNYFVIKVYKAKKAIEKSIVLMENYVKDTSHEGLVVPQLLEVVNRPKKSRSQYIAFYKDPELEQRDHLFYLGIFTCILSRTTSAIHRSSSVRDIFDEGITGIPEQRIASEIQGRFSYRVRQEITNRFSKSWLELLHDKAFKRDVVGLHFEKYVWPEVRKREEE